MAYGEIFNEGDRVVYDNITELSHGRVSKVNDNEYEVVWDDGFEGEPGETYTSDELTAEPEV